MLDKHKTDPGTDSLKKKNNVPLSVLLAKYLYLRLYQKCISFFALSYRQIQGNLGRRQVLLQPPFLQQ